MSYTSNAIALREVHTPNPSQEGKRYVYFILMNETLNAIVPREVHTPTLLQRGNITVGTYYRIPKSSRISYSKAISSTWIPVISLMIPITPSSTSVLLTSLVGRINFS